MNHATLFSGIGGPELAADWMGWTNIFHCEINPFGSKVLNYYWPKSDHYENIKKTDFTKYRGTIDVLTGGFPCQPYSVAGEKKGTEDERHLWPEMLRAIGEIQPRYVVGENVFGLVGWNGGMVFEEVQTDLEAIGYEVQTVLLPACGVDAPHKRERLFIVAHSYDKGLQRGKEKRELGKNRKERNEQPSGCFRDIWEKFPTQSPLRGGNDGIPKGLVGITVPKHRIESIKAFGNAIVPQVIHQIYKTIQEYEIRHIQNNEVQRGPGAI